MIDKLEEFCGPLTDSQKSMVNWHVENGSFVGYGKGIGMSGTFPVVRRGTGPMSIVDRAGYEQFAAKYPRYLD